jgi:hypothetical protein
MAPKCRINKSLYILNICTIFLNLFVSESMNLSRRCMDSLITMKDLYITWYCHLKCHFDAQIAGCDLRPGMCKTISFIQKSKDLKVE